MCDCVCGVVFMYVPISVCSAKKTKLHKSLLPLIKSFLSFNVNLSCSLIFGQKIGFFEVPETVVLELIFIAAEVFD